MKRIIAFALLLPSIALAQPTPGNSTKITDGAHTAAVTASSALKTDSSATTQPVSASSLPLPAGASTAAKQPALGTAGSASADVLSVQGVASMTPLKTDGSGVTQPVSGTVSVTGNVDITPASPAANDYISCRLTDGTSYYTASGGGGGASPTEYTEDAASASDPVGGMLIARRRDTLSSSEVSADGDNIALNATNKGQLQVKLADTVTVDGSGVTQPVSASSLPLPSGAATAANQTTGNSSLSSIDGKITACNTGAVVVSSSGLPSGAATAAKQDTQTTSLQLIDDLVFGEDAAHLSGDKGVMPLAVRNDTRGALAGTDGDYSPFQVNSSGDLRVDGSAVTQPISASSLPLPTGAATESTLSTLNGKVTACNTGAVVVSSGSLTCNAGTNLNTSALALESGGNLATVAGAVKAEDAASANADTGIPALAVRKATPANTSGTDGDYEPLQVSAGRLWTSATIDAALPTGSNVIGHVVADSGSTASCTQSGTWTVQPGNTANTTAWKVDGSAVTQPVSGTFWQATQPVSLASVPSHAVTNAGTFAVQESGSQVIADDSAFTPATSKVSMAGFEFDDTSPDSVDEGDAGAARMSANRNVYMQIRDAAGNERGVNVNASNQLAVAGPVTNAGTFAVQATEADGANTTLGAKADAKSTATDTTAVTIMQVLKEISAMEQAPASRAVTNAGTFAVQSTLQANSGVDIGKLTANQTVDLNKVAGTATDTNSGNKSAGTLRVVLATDQPSLTNSIPVTPTPGTTGGWSVSSQTALSNTKTTVKSSAATLGGYMFYNPNSSVEYIQVFDVASASVTVGTTTPTYVIPIPATSGANVEFTNGINHATAIVIAATTTATGSTAPGTALTGFFVYK